MTNVMSSDLHTDFQTVRNDAIWAHCKWGQFRQLYSDPETVRVLKHTAPFFFGVLKDTFMDDLLLSICRLTDPATMGRNGRYETLGLKFLVLSIDQSLRTGADSCLARIEAPANNVRVHRDQRIAHRDKRVAGNHAPSVLPPVHRQDIDTILDEIAGLMNLIESHYSLSPTTFSEPIVSGGADVLLFWLREAMKREQEERQQFGV